MAGLAGRHCIQLGENHSLLWLHIHSAVNFTTVQVQLTRCCSKKVWWTSVICYQFHTGPTHYSWKYVSPLL